MTHHPWRHDDREHLTEQQSEIHAFRHTPRKKLSEHQMLKIFFDRGGRCHVCKRKLRCEKYEIDHIIALENGGTDTADNLAPCCLWCHKGKTKEDAGKAAKMRAIAVSVYLPSNLRKRKWPPMPGSRRSLWKKKMDGTTERR